MTLAQNVFENGNISNFSFCHIIYNIKYQISYCNQSNTSSMCTVHKAVVKGSSVKGCHTNL